MSIEPTEDRVWGLEVAVIRMRETATARAEARVNALSAAKTRLASRTAAAIEQHGQAVTKLDSLTGPIPPPNNSVGRGFRVSGQVTSADTGIPIPELRLRLVDDNGVVLLEKPFWITGGDGRYVVDVTAAEAKANVSARLEISDSDGNPLQRLDRMVTAGQTLEANVVLDTPPTGSALARQISATKAQVDRVAQVRAQLQANIDALKARHEADQAAIDAEVANLQIALKSLTHSASETH